MLILAAVVAALTPASALPLPAVKAIAGPSGGPGEGLKLVEKAKAAVSAVKVAQALDAIAGDVDILTGGRDTFKALCTP